MIEKMNLEWRLVVTKIRNKKWIIVFLLLILIVCFKVIYERQSISFTVSQKMYTNYNGHNNITIYFPQLSGMRDKEKEFKINVLIEEDIKKILSQSPLYAESNLFLYLNYEVELLSKNIISIVYRGSEGAAVNNHSQIPCIFMATTINFEKEAVLSLNDFITDFDELSRLLLADKFKNISTWDEERRAQKISWSYEGEKEKLLLEQLINAKDFDLAHHYIEWYTDGKNLIIVAIEPYSYYTEYAIDFKEIKNIVMRG